MKYIAAALLLLAPVAAFADAQVISSGNGTVTINGQTYHGRNINVTGNGNVVIDGVSQPGKPMVGPITIVVNGSADSIKTSSGKVQVKGNAGDITTMSGDVHVGGTVGGNVKTMSGDVSAKSIAGKAVSQSGDVDTF